MVTGSCPACYEFESVPLNTCYVERQLPVKSVEAQSPQVCEVWNCWKGKRDRKPLTSLRLFFLKIGVDSSQTVLSPVRCSKLRLTTGVNVSLCRDEFRVSIVNSRVLALIPMETMKDALKVSQGVRSPSISVVRSCQVIYSQFGLAIHQNDHQARRRFVEWAQNEIAVVPDFHKRILFSDEAHFWLNGYANKQNCRIWSEANPQVYVETPLHPEKLTVWCALWAGGIIGPYFQKR
ncbi:uncharacterized protein TNCV_470621 [Trichonephila clavipes]|nr:uncharacterized protein TNCV_470621 [Trichonephila clavipes]